MNILFSLFMLVNCFGVELLTDGIKKIDVGLNPVELVQMYLKKDSQGEFLHKMDWWNKAVACPNCMGGPDALTVISNYKMKKVSSNVFNVTYSVEGTFSNGQFTRKKETREKVFTVAKTNWGYKIDQMAFQMVLADKVIEKFSANLNPTAIKALKLLVKK